MKLPITLLLLAALTTGAQAQTNPTAASGSKWDVYLGVDVGEGGDKIMEVGYTNGTHQTLYAGNALHFKAGAQYKFNTNTSLRTSVGTEFTTTHGADGNISFSKIPIEAIGFYQFGERARLGAGLRYAALTTLHGLGIARDLGSIRFHSSLGAVVEGEFLLSPQWGVSLRAVSEKYTFEGETLKGNHISLGMNWYF